MMQFPNSKQVVGSSTCGPSCLLNIYTHLGIKTDLDKILADLKISDKKSTYATQLAAHMRDMGLETILLASSPRMVSPAWSDKTKSQLVENLEAWLRNNKKDKWINNVKHLIKYLKKEGKIIITDLTTEMIDLYLDKGYLILCCLEESWIWGKRKIRKTDIFDDIKGGVEGHFVVVYGKRDENCLVSDPFPTGINNREGLYEISKDKLLVATLVWSGQMVAVKNEG